MKKPLHETIQESVQKAWSDTRTALEGMEAQVQQRLRQLRERADWQQNIEEVHRSVADFVHRLQQNSEGLEQRLQESLRIAMTKLRAPILDELAALRGKAEQLGQRIEGQLKRRHGGGQDSKDGERHPQ